LRATELALQQAGLRNDPEISDGRMGIAYGSSAGSIEPVRVFGQMLDTGSMQGVTSTTYIQMMPHTAAVNVGLYFGLKGRVVPTSSACTSGSMAIGYAYEAIRARREPMMVAGGAEELSAPGAAVFDTLFATSTKNDAPSSTPRPFDKKRDGLVIGEGAATLVLEDLEHAKARGATPIVEIIGFATNSDGMHVTQPDDKQQARAMSPRPHRRRHSRLGDRLRQRARHRDRPGRHRRGTRHRERARRIGSGLVDEELRRPYPRRVRRDRGLVDDRDDARKWFAPTINLDTPDPECESARPGARRRPHAGHRTRDEEQLRVRRHQHFPRFPKNLSSRRVVVTGMGIVSCLGNDLETVCARAARRVARESARRLTSPRTAWRATSRASRRSNRCRP
jgi:3-oxoacyl-[acyl-carrier-protein] synthase II